MERFNSDCLIVFGDSYNDQSMFEIANYGVAVGNTPEIIKNLSHFQVEASPTGIKQAIIWVQNQLNIRQTEKLHHT
jgi:hydroxymethylpyrimidine pyrophosphatase-like HAD family hydrolase